MPSKTISLRLEAYERLRRARRHSGESFSDVVMRAVWADEPATAAEYLRYRRKTGPLLLEADLDRVEALKRVAEPPVAKWKAT